MPTRNRAGWLERALRSVFSQTVQPAEIIVVDDASDDATPGFLQDFGKNYPGLMVIRNEKPKGAAASRNIAIRAARGEFITGIDDDDFWMPARLEKLYKGFRQQPCAGVCSYDQLDFGKRKITWKKKSAITLEDLLYYNMAGNQVFTKKEFLMQAGLFDEALPSAQDYDLWIRLAAKFGPIITVPEVLQIVNMNENEQRITTSAKQIEGYHMCFKKHAAKMSGSQKKYQQYRLKLASGKSASWRELAASTPRRLLFKEIKRKLFAFLY